METVAVNVIWSRI